MRLNEEQKPVFEFVVIAAANPEAKPIVLDWDNSAPVFGDGIERFESLATQPTYQKFRGALAVSPRIDFVFLGVVGRKKMRAKLNVRFH